MLRTFTVKVVLTAIVVTIIGNAPARANENVAGALATLLGVAVLSTVVANQFDDDDDDDDDDRVTRSVHDRGYYGYEQNRFSHSNRVKPRPLPQRANRTLLPRECLNRFGDRRVFGKYCLQRNYGFVRSLPDRCEVRYRVRGQKYKGYSAQCLRREGYRLARN